MKVQKSEGRAEYLRHVLSKTVAAEVLDKPHLTYGDAVNANSMLYEYWQLTRKADVDRALGQPAGQEAAKRSKEANAFRRFATGAGWCQEDHAQLVENMKRIKREFPAVVSNKDNSDAIAGWLLEQKRYPSYANMRLAVTTLASKAPAPCWVHLSTEGLIQPVENSVDIARLPRQRINRVELVHNCTSR
jgi:hypothetical protein